MIQFITFLAAPCFFARFTMHWSPSSKFTGGEVWSKCVDVTCCVCRSFVGLGNNLVVQALLKDAKDVL